LNSEIAAAQLQVLRRVVSEEYGPAIDHALELIENAQRLIDRERVVSLLTTRAQNADYLVLQSVLLDMAEAVSGL
jgi:hypothetical protein